MDGESSLQSGITRSSLPAGSGPFNTIIYEVHAKVLLLTVITVALLSFPSGITAQGPRLSPLSFAWREAEAPETFRSTCA